MVNLTVPLSELFNGSFYAEIQALSDELQASGISDVTANTSRQSVSRETVRNLNRGHDYGTDLKG
jgi:hypothetical protein